jgi:hypothetical protein
MTTMLLARRSVLPRLAPLLLPLSLLLLGVPRASAGPPTNSAAQADFQRLHPCPANDARLGECPGYVIDYVVPRCMGGPDEPYNMRWQTLDEAKARIAADARRCPTPRTVEQVDTRLTT